MIKINFRKLLEQKGAIFGLDARLVLIILALVSLGMAISDGKQITSEQKIGTKLELKLLRNKFLDNWEKIRFDGYGNAETGLIVNNITVVPFNATSDRKRMLDSSNAWDITEENEADFNHPDVASQVYKNVLYYSSTDFYKFASQYVKAYFNYKTGVFNPVDPNSYFRQMLSDFNSRTYNVFKLMAKKDGFAKLSSTADSDISGDGSRNMLTLGKDEFKRDIRIYFIVENNVNKYSPSEYIVNVVLYSLGQNGILDSTLPTSIAELRTFASERDDVFEIFTTRDTYLKAKSENLRRLTLIADKVKAKAEIDYVTRLSYCDNWLIVVAACDLDSNGSYTWNDKKLLKEYNMYLKSSLDTTGINYLDSTVYTFRDGDDGLTDSETFVRDGLGLPKYLATDLFGNMINYNSNVELSTESPYLMEVWY
ncbi:MAG: hypothetical protein GY793_06020 [Proteobacteria bacterium]|nr:hypothetical protein [Pseudomonadota bacterium]